MFNIIDTSAGRKVDLIPATMKPGYDFALANRIRREIPSRRDIHFEAWFAQPEDVIVGKLMAWNEGRAFKHEQDIRDVLVAVILGDDAEISASFDTAYVSRWAPSLGTDVEQLWRDLIQLIGFARFKPELPGTD
jgi:hypothetical protein